MVVTGTALTGGIVGSSLRHPHRVATWICRAVLAGLLAGFAFGPAAAQTPKEADQPKQIATGGGDANLVVPIRPRVKTDAAIDLNSALIPLSDGSVIDFSTWMALKYGVAGVFESDAARLDRETGRTTLTVYGLERESAPDFEEGIYDFRPQLPGCGLLTQLLTGESKCQPNWQIAAADLVGTGVLAPQMVGIADFNPHTAVTPADMELGRIRLGPPVPILSMVP